MAPDCARPILREAGMMDSVIPEGLTFDDVLLLPGRSAVLPTEVDTTTHFARKLPVNIPLASAAMDTVTISPDITLRQALEIMTKYKISGLPVTRGSRLTGILTNRDLRFEKNHSQLVSSVMTKDNLVTVEVGTTSRKPSASCKSTA